MKRASAAVLAVSLALFAAACGGESQSGSSDGTAASGSGGAGKITIGVSIPVAQFMPAFLAQEEGLFAKQGLDVEVKTVRSAQLLSSLTSGSIQFGISSGPQLELGALKGPIKQLANWADHLDAYVIGAPGITSMQQLKGKRFGVNVPGALPSVFARYALLESGLTPDKDVRVVPLGSSPVDKAFISKQIDAMVATPPLTLLVKKGRPGSDFIYSFHDLPWTGAELAGNASWIEQHKDATLGVIRAINGGLRSWNRDPKAAKAVIAKQGQVTDPKILDASYDFTRKIFLHRVEPVTEKLERSVLGVLQKTGTTQASPERAASIIDPSYVRQALAGGK